MESKTRQKQCQWILCRTRAVLAQNQDQNLSPVAKRVLWLRRGKKGQVGEQQISLRSRNKCQSSTSEQTEWDKKRIFLWKWSQEHSHLTVVFQERLSSSGHQRYPVHLPFETCVFTWKLKIIPFLRRPTEAVPILLEITAAGHEQLITAFFCVTLRVKFDREVDSTRNVNFILRKKHMIFVYWNTRSPKSYLTFTIQRGRYNKCYSISREQNPFDISIQN